MLGPLPGPQALRTEGRACSLSPIPARPCVDGPRFLSHSHSHGPPSGGHPVNRTGQLLCTYCGYAFVVVFCVGFVGFAGFVPPPSPAASAAEIAAFYRDDVTDIRIGMFITLFAASFLLAWGGAV